MSAQACAPVPGLLDCVNQTLSLLSASLPSVFARPTYRSLAVVREVSFSLPGNIHCTSFTLLLGLWTPHGGEWRRGPCEAMHRHRFFRVVDAPMPGGWGAGGTDVQVLRLPPPHPLASPPRPRCRFFSSRFCRGQRVPRLCVGGPTFVFPALAPRAFVRSAPTHARLAISLRLRFRVAPQRASARNQAGSSGPLKQ